MDLLGVELVTLLLLLAIAFAGSVIGALSGFGGALMVIPFLVPVVGIEAVLPIITCAMIIGNGGRVFAYRHTVRWDLAGRLALTVAPGVVIGALIYDSLPLTGLAFLIGGFLIISVPLRWLLKGRTIEASGAGLSAIGLGFGVLAGSTPGAGVILVSVLLGLGLTGGSLVGTDAVLGMLVSLVRASMFGTFDLIDLGRLTLGILLGMVMVPGALAGRWLLARLPVRLHVAVIELFIVASGISIIWQGLTA
jgi:uncharacterized membrane protein YfcA